MNHFLKFQAQLNFIHLTKNNFNLWIKIILADIQLHQNHHFYCHLNFLKFNQDLLYFQFLYKTLEIHLQFTINFTFQYYKFDLNSPFTIFQSM